MPRFARTNYLTRLVPLALALVTLAAASARSDQGASEPDAQFFEGMLNRAPDRADWPVWIAIKGSRAYGISFNAEGGRSVPVRLDGRYNAGNRQLEMSMYAADPGRGERRIGHLSSTVARAGDTMTGRFSVPEVELRGVRFNATRAPADITLSSTLVGRYRFEIEEIGGTVTLDKGGKFSVRGRLSDIPFGLATGLWQVDQRGNLWLLPLTMRESNPFITLAVKTKMPIKMDYARQGNELVLLDPFHQTVLLVLTER